MKTRYIVLLVAGLFLLALFADRNAGVFNADRLKWMNALDWAVTAFGVTIAAISSLRLLSAAAQGHKLPQILPTVLALFAGLSLFQRFWAVHISFAAIVVGWLVVEHFRPAPNNKSES